MDRDRKSKDNVDEFEKVHADVLADGMPSWSERELKSKFADERKTRAGIDKPYLVLTLLLLLIGLIMLLSASFSSAMFRSQVVFAVIGIVLMLVVSRFSSKLISRWSTHLLLASIALLILVLVIGIRVNGATRWLGVGGVEHTFSFQPSEVAKLAIILAFAQMSAKFGETRMRTIRYGFLPFAAITAVIMILLWRQPHVSAVIIVGVTAVIMMFTGGTRLRYFILSAIVIALVAWIFLVSDMFELTGLGHWGRRIDIWLNPEADPLGGGFQVRQSLNAIGSGGMLGQGLGLSRQKHQYLPEEHNDFIFAIVAEELGFVGAIMILCLFALLVVRGFWLALNAKDRYSSLIVIGISSLLAVQVFINVAVVTSLIPATGVALPLFSSGGTALMIQLVQMGIVLAVSREIPAYKEADRNTKQECLT